MLREIREEVGITDVVIKRVAYVTLVNSNPPYLIIAYFCESNTDEVVLSNEHQSFVWADKDECLKRLPKPIIDDFERNQVFECFHVY